MAVFNPSYPRPRPACVLIFLEFAQESFPILKLKSDSGRFSSPREEGGRGRETRQPSFLRLPTPSPPLRRSRFKEFKRGNRKEGRKWGIKTLRGISHFPLQLSPHPSAPF